MAVDDLIRLAWEAEHDGRNRLRDSALTLAVAEGRPGDGWAERCRDRLVRERPDHFFGQFATLAGALDDPRVLEARDRLRLKYPDARVQWLLLKAAAARGPYLGRVESLEAMIDDLAGPGAILGGLEAENVRLDAAHAAPGPIQRLKAGRTLALTLSYPALATGLEDAPAPATRRGYPDLGEFVDEPPLEDVATYYLTVLLAIALLLATVQQGQESRG